MEIEIITAKEAAELIKSTLRTVERKAQSGQYPSDVCGQHGRFWLFNKQKLLQHIFKSA